MKKNEHFVVEIEDISGDGLGIGHVDGKAYFIKDAIRGDMVEAIVTKEKNKYGYGRLHQVLQPSVYRVEPKCKLARICGGCQLQELDYQEQIQWKTKQIIDKFQRIGNFSKTFIEEIIEPTIVMEEPFRYRNKAQFPVGTDKEKNPIAGFYGARSHRIIPVEDCLLGVEENKEIMECVLRFLKEHHIKPYDETTNTGWLRHVLIRKSFAYGELMVCLVVNGKSLPKQELLVDELKKIPGMTSISLNCNEENTNVILGKDTTTLWGKDVIRDRIGEIDFEISPPSFFQVNPRQTEKLYQLAMEYAGLTGDEIVWDLYCGIGTISLFLAQKAKKVYGVEIIPEAIEDAKKNAKRNGITNAEFYVGKAEEIFAEFVKNNEEKADIVVVDPPRKGCDKNCLEAILTMQPQKVVYVSCDPATLARDVRILVDGGYQLEKLRGLDQFSHTTHVETVALVSRVK